MRSPTQLIEQLGNLLRAEERQAGSVHGLQPVHLQALHYLLRCNRYSDLPASVTDYLGLTKGTVSQTLLVLEKKRYIEKHPDVADRRSVHLALTPRRETALERSRATSGLVASGERDHPGRSSKA